MTNTSTSAEETVEIAVVGTPAAATAPTDPAALRAEIEQTRADLADTVEALAAKLDVKAQVGSAVSQAKDRVRASADRMTGRTRRAQRRMVASIQDPSTSAVGDPAGLDLTLDVAADRRRRTRNQSIVAAGVAGLALLAVAVWALRRNAR